MGLSTGEIVGIVIGVILAVIFLFFIYLWIKRMIASRREAAREAAREAVPVALSTEAEAAREAARKAETIYKEAAREGKDYFLPDGTKIDFAAIGRQKRLEEQRKTAEEFQEDQRVRGDAEITRILNEYSKLSRDRDANVRGDQIQNQLELLESLPQPSESDLIREQKKAREKRNKQRDIIIDDLELSPEQEQDMRNIWKQQDLRDFLAKYKE